MDDQNKEVAQPKSPNGDTDIPKGEVKGVLETSSYIQQIVQPNAVSQDNVELAPPRSKIDFIGIVSILLFICPPAGLAAGLIGASTAKKEQRNPLLSRIGWIINLAILVFAILWIVWTAFFSAFARGL